MNTRCRRALLVVLLSVSAASVAGGTPWLQPGQRSDPQIGARTDNWDPHLDFHEGTGNLFVVMRDGSRVWAVYISGDNGANWSETFQFDVGPGENIVDLDAVVIGDYLYVSYIMSSYPNDVSLRRFHAADGSSDSSYDYYDVVSGSVRVVEAALASNEDEAVTYTRLYFSAILEDGTLRHLWSDGDGGVGALGWTEVTTSVVNASGQLDMAYNASGFGAHLFASFFGSNLKFYVLRIGGIFTDQVELTASGDSYSRARMRIAAFADHVAVLYEIGTITHNGIRYFISHDGGMSWTWEELASASGPTCLSVTGRRGLGFTMAYEEEASLSNEMFMRHRGYVSGLTAAEAWGGLYSGFYCGTIEGLPTGGYGAVQIQSSTAIFQRLPLLLRDGFNLGNTDAWSSITP